MQEGLVVLSKDDIVVFMIVDGEVVIHYVPFEEAKEDTKSRALCGIALVADHKN